VSLGSAPTSFTGNTGAGSAPLCIGSVVNGTYIAGITGFSSGQAKLYSTLTITQPGVYIFSYNALSTASNASFNNMGAFVDDAFNGSSNVNYLAYYQIPFISNVGASSTLSLSSAQIYTVTATTTFGLYLNVNIGSGTINSSPSQFSFRFVRIA